MKMALKREIRDICLQLPETGMGYHLFLHPKNGTTLIITGGETVSEPNLIETLEEFKTWYLVTKGGMRTAVSSFNLKPYVPVAQLDRAGHS